MAEESSHPTSGRRCRVKGPPSTQLPLPRLEHASDTEKEHSDDSAGEKEAKRQRSEPTTPVSTHSLNPYDYDAVMGITRVGTKEAEGFEKDLDSPEYHDTIDEPTKRGEEEGCESLPRLGSIQGGYGSSSLKECIELLNATTCNAPAPLDSGVALEIPDPTQVMSPNMDGSLAEASVPASSGSTSQVTSRVKDEPQAKDEPALSEETKLDDNAPNPEMKREQKESEREEEVPPSVKQEEHPPESDSEPDSESDLEDPMMMRERVIQELHRLVDARNRRVSAQTPPNAEEETSASQTTPRERTLEPGGSRERGYGPYSSHPRRLRGRYPSPDPYLFSDTIFLEHEPDPSTARDNPMRDMQERLMCVEHNIATLRTRVTQVADLRDAQGIRRDQNTIVARLNEVEEYASAHTFREFVSKIQRLESMLVGNGGGTVGEAIHVCSRRIDQQQALLDEMRNRARTQDRNVEGSDENSENVSGRENRTTDRRRRRGPLPQGAWRSPMPRPPPPPQTDESVGSVHMQQAMQRLHVAYTQCVNRTNHVEERLDQVRSAIQRDATDLALMVHRHEQSVTDHHRKIQQLNESVEEAQAKIKGLDQYSQKIVQHEHHVNQTIDRNTHSQTASICALIKEYEDMRKMVTELANCVDQSQDGLNTPRDETNTNVLLELGDLRTKITRLTEQHTTLEGDVSFLKGLSEEVEELGNQICKWNGRLPSLNDESDEKVPTAIEVQEDLDLQAKTNHNNFHYVFNKLHTLEGMISALERSRDESWEAVSNRVSTLVESSVVSLSGRMTELEKAVQSQRTTPVDTEDATANAETWAALEQVIWAELGKIKDQMHEIPKLYALCEQIQRTQQSQEKQLSVLRRFAREVEHHLEQLHKGATPPGHTHISQALKVVDMVCRRHMCLVLLRQVRRSHLPISTCQHHQLFLHHQFQKKSHPHKRKVLLCRPLMGTSIPKPTSVQW